MWIWRRTEKISWRDKVTNKEVLRRVNEVRQILNSIWLRKHRRIGHVLRHDELLHEIIEGRMKGKPTRGRRRIQMLHDLANDGGYQWHSYDYAWNACAKQFFSKRAPNQMTFYGDCRLEKSYESSQHTACQV